MSEFFHLSGKLSNATHSISVPLLCKGGLGLSCLRSRGQGGQGRIEGVKNIFSPYLASSYEGQEPFEAGYFARMNFSTVLSSKLLASRGMADVNVLSFKKTREPDSIPLSLIALAGLSVSAFGPSIFSIFLFGSLGGCDGEAVTTYRKVVSGKYTYYPDKDGDGYGDPDHTVQSYMLPAGYVFNNKDCNDSDPLAYPSAGERCNGIDDDCDGEVDEDFIGKTIYYRDTDEDGYGDESKRSGYMAWACEDVPCPEEWSEENCEVYGDHVCHEASLEEALERSLEYHSCDIPEDYIEIGGDCDDSNADINPEILEICNGLDDNCDGEIDEGFDEISVCRDLDGDGFGNTNNCKMSCYVPDGYADNAGDCNDRYPRVNAGAIELCNDRDDNCDGEVDNDADGQSVCIDADEDGFYSLDSNGEDCDDGDADIYPDAVEICNGVDDDCDGETDEGVRSEFYMDEDGDGYGDPERVVLSCNRPDGYSDNNLDCDDGDADINPLAAEICNGLDDNCDQVLDEGLPQQIYYPDNDGDGYGDRFNEVSACTAPPDHIELGRDCDDTNRFIYPDDDGVCITGSKRLTNNDLGGAQHYDVAWANNVLGLVYSRIYFDTYSSNGELINRYHSILDRLTRPYIMSNGNAFAFSSLLFEADIGELFFSEFDDDSEEINLTRVSNRQDVSKSTVPVWNGNNYALAWASHNDAIYFARLDENGNKIGDDVLIARFDTYVSAIHMDWFEDYYILSYTDWSGINLDIVDIDGNVSEDIDYSYLGRINNSTFVKYGNAYYFVCSDSDQVLTSYIVSPDTNLMPGIHTLSHNLSLVGIIELVHGESDLGLVLQGQGIGDDDESTETYFMRLSNAGARIGDIYMISPDDQRTSYHPDIVWAGDRYIVTWQETVDRHNIYSAQIFIN